MKTPPANPASDASRSQTWAAVVTLALVALLTFANAAPDALVFDDKAFAGPEPMIQLESLAHAFTDDLWRHDHAGGLYRPLLQINLELENRLFGDWLRGFHLVNIALHLAATLLLFGFLRLLLQRDGRSGQRSTLLALLAAAVFAVHPAHAEVVNSVFNRSSMIVTICAVGGLWWLFHHLEARPARAWAGLALAYSVGILFKESALVLPGIAVALIVLLTGGDWRARVRRFLPVFWLLIPITLYFLARGWALAPAGTGEEGVDEFSSIFEVARIAGRESPAAALALFGEGLKVLAWPYPAKLIYERPGDATLFAYLAIQVVLGAWALWLLWRGRPAMAASLAFYYIALFPSTRLLSMDGVYPHLAERYLYFPSAGLAIALAFGFAALVRRFGPRPIAGLTLPLLVLLAAVSWERNADWASEILLFEKEYQRGERNAMILRVLPGALSRAGQHARVAEICDENLDMLGKATLLVDACVVAYSRLQRTEDVISALEIAKQHDRNWLSARLTLASVYIALRQRDKAARQYEEIINRLEDTAGKEFYKGELYFKVYGEHAEALERARDHFRAAAELDPDIEVARERLAEVEQRLGELGERPATPNPEDAGS